MVDILAEMLGESAAIEAVRQNIRRLLARSGGARRMPSILIQGETGTGKGLVARLIHRAGPRSTGPFVDVNCAAIPDALLEAELFGFEQGAFTDARRAKPGLFQAAHHGTIFLDEVGLLPEPLQPKLLKVIEEQTVRRLGGTKSEPADVWVICATNADLADAIRQRRFREDLYHRLSVLTLTLPPLRERGSDVILLAERFLARACEDYGLEPKTLSASAHARLRAYPWPGNIRELFNAIERVVLLSEAAEVGMDVLPIAAGWAEAPGPARVPPATGEQPMRELVNALEQTGWNISRTAAMLGLTRVTVRARMTRFGLRRAKPQAGLRPVPPEPTPSAPSPRSQDSPAPGHASGPRWETRRVTFLRAEVLTSDDAQSLTEQNRALETIVDKIRSFGGELNELGPVRIGAVLGLVPAEDAPRRAAHAAMAIQKAAQRTRQEGGQLEIKIGIHTAQVLVAQLGTATEIDADARQTHWALLDQLLARPGAEGIVVSPDAAQFLERRFHLSAEQRSDADRSASYRLVGPERPGLALKGRMTAFVGRQQELALLKARLESAKDGHGQCVTIVGETGIGKSRLLHEFRRSVRGEQVTYLEGHCLSYGSGMPYLPVLELLRQACRLTDLDTPAQAAMKIRASLQGLAIDATAALPYLLWFLGVKDEADGPAPLNLETAPARTFDILRRVVVNAARRRPLVIAVEDVHWIDAASEGLASTVSNLTGTPLLVLLTCRPDYQARWVVGGNVTRIALPPLSSRDSQTFVRTLLATERIGEDVAHSILERAEGNPLFLEELTRAFAERSKAPAPIVARVQSEAEAPDRLQNPGLVAEPASSERRDADVVQVPPTIHAVLAARIDRLPPNEKMLLQCAAVLGKDVSTPLLEAIAGMADSDVHACLGHLQASGFLHESGVLPDLECSFSHALTQEVAYDSLPPARRKALHTLVLDAIERRPSSRQVETAAWLAHHAVRAEAWQRAATHLWQAGRDARARSAYREAVLFLEQALDVMRRLPPGPQSKAAMIDLVCADLSDPLLTLTQYDRVLGHLRDAASIAEEIGDRGRLANVLARTVVALRVTGQEHRGVEVGERAVALAEQVGDGRLNALANIELAFAHYGTGDVRRSEARLRRALDAVDALPAGGEPDTRWLRRRTLGLLVLVLTLRGRYQEAIDQGEEALRMAEDLGQPGPIVGALYRLGLAYTRRGDIDKGIEVCSRSFLLAEEHGVPDGIQGAAASLGLAFTMAGRTDEAVLNLEKAVAASDSRYGVGAFVGVLLGEAYVAAGRLDDAVRCARQAHEMCRVQTRRHVEVAALLLSGDIAARRESAPVDEALTFYGQALALADELQLSPDAARAHRAMGRLHRQGGDHTRARQHLDMALLFYREADAPFWAAAVEAEIAELT